MLYGVSHNLRTINSEHIPDLESDDSAEIFEAFKYICHLKWVLKVFLFLILPIMWKIAFVYFIMIEYHPAYMAQN